MADADGFRGCTGPAEGGDGLKARLSLTTQDAVASDFQRPYSSTFPKVNIRSGHSEIRTDNTADISILNIRGTHPQIPEHLICSVTSPGPGSAIGASINLI